MICTGNSEENYVLAFWSFVTMKLRIKSKISYFSLLYIAITSLIMGCQYILQTVLKEAENSSK